MNQSVETGHLVLSTAMWAVGSISVSILYEYFSLYLTGIISYNLDIKKSKLFYILQIISDFSILNIA